MESSIKELIDDIVTNLPIHPSKPAPKYFVKYGKNMKYTGFRKDGHRYYFLSCGKYPSI